MIVNQHHLIHNLSKEKQDIFQEDSILRAPNSFYLFKAKRQNEVHGQPISYQQLIDEWNTMSKDQKAEFESQAECLQFTMDIDQNNKKKSTHFIPKILLPPSTTTSSMVIPNDHSVDNSPTSSKEDEFYMDQSPHLYHHSLYQYSSHDHFHSSPSPPDKLIPNLSYSAAAEAAALQSLSFNNNNNTEKQSKITTSQSTKRKYGIIPEKVKRPPNAYLLFNRDMRRQLHDVHQGLSSGEISKSISQRWKQLPQEQKDYYFREESKLKQKHNEEHANFIYTRRSKAEMKKADSLKQQSKQTKKQDTPKPPPKKKSPQPSEGKDPRGRKKKRADESLPKHPMSGYLHFAKKMRPIMKREKPEARLVDISREIGLRWRSMTPQEMQPWIDMSNQDKARYAQEMKDRIQEDAQSFSSHSSTSSNRKFSSNTSAVVLEELDSETIATVAQMVNPTK